jgi:hypothetical protein
MKRLEFTKEDLAALIRDNPTAALEYTLTLRNQLASLSEASHDVLVWANKAGLADIRLACLEEALEALGGDK